MADDTPEPSQHVPARPRAVNGLEPMLSAREVAEALRVPKSCVYYLVKRHGLPVRKIGKYFRFYRHELVRWIEEHKESQR